MDGRIFFPVQLIIYLSTLYCCTKWQTKKKAQSVLYNACLEGKALNIHEL